MAIHLRSFAGEIPRVAPRLLPETHAALSMNARLTRGDLDPISAPIVTYTAPAACESIYKNGTEWLTFNDASTRVVPGPVATDRLYITSNGAAPQMRVAGAMYPLALNAPTGRPSISRNGTLDPDLQELVLYCYTWVTQWGEESQISPISQIYWSPGCTITLSNMPAPPSGRGITHQRIYRSVTTATGETEFFFVAQIPATDTTYLHNLEAAPIQEAIPSRDYDPPPANMRGIVAMPNGMMAAFAGKEVLFCEPYRPHAWPVKYRQAVTEQIVALAAFGSSVAVLTKGTPWIAQGLHPEQMAMEKSEQPFPCLAALGVVDMGYSAIYPSTDGLVEVSQSGARLLSSPLWSRAEWEAMVPETFRAAQFAGRYAFSHVPSGTTRVMGFVDTRGEQPFYHRADFAAHDLAADLATGDLYALDAADRRRVVEFDRSNASERAGYMWRSRPFYSGRPVSIGAVFVEATTVRAGSEVRIYGDGNLIGTIPGSQFNTVARVRSGRWNEIQVEAAGASTIARISIGQMPDEVRL